MRFIAIYLVLCATYFARVICDGDHGHSHAATDSGSAPTGSVTTVHTTSGDPARGSSQSAFSGILQNLSPDVINNLAGNPAIAGALRAYGIDPSTITAAKAAAEAGGSVPPPPPEVGGKYDYPPPPAQQHPFGGFGGYGGGYPFLPFFGPYKQLHVSGDVGGYFPIVEKAVIFFGGGILILLILAFLAKAFGAGGILSNLGAGFSEALAGAGSVDVGPFHKSVAGSGAVNVGGARPFQSTPSNLQLTQRVQDGIDQRF